MSDLIVKAAIYVRQSVDAQEGIDRGLQRCKTLVASRGWSLVGEYADNAVSASKARKAGSAWSTLLADVKAGKVDVVVGVDVDRLVRSIQDLGTLIDLGVRVLTVDGEIDLTTADGEFRATMLAGIARFEVRRKAERQKRANAHRTTQLGLPVPGKRRFGFQAGNIKADPVEAPQVKKAYADALEGVPVYRIAQELSRPPVRVREILSNPAYAGWVPYGDQRYEAAPEVDRIVDRQVWESVQAILADPSRKTSPGNTISYLASGIARCALCNSRLVKLGPNYICKTDLSHVSIKQTMLDEHLKWEAFSFIASQENTPSGEVIALSTQLAELLRLRTVQQTMASWEGVDLAAIRTELSRLGKEIERVEADLAAARSSAVVEDVISALRSELSDQEGADWWEEKWEDLGLDGRRQVLRNLSVVVDKGRGLERVTVASR